MSPLLAFSGGLIATLLLIKLVLPISQKFGVIDEPNIRKHHLSPTPIIGGVSSFIIFLIFCRVFSINESAYIYASIILVISGLVDDYYNISVRVRLIIQIIITSALIYSNDLYFSPPDVFVDIFENAYGILGLKVITMIFIVGMINAFNMLDGADGLLGMIAIVTGSILLFLIKDPQKIQLLAIFMGTIAGFLYFNIRTPFRKTASVFMGDAGSMWVGFTLAMLCVSLSSEHNGFSNYPAALSFWILGFPLIETLSVIHQRLLEGQSPFQGDRKHLHHVMERKGFNIIALTSIITGLSLAISLIGYALYLYFNNEIVMYLALICVLIIYCVIKVSRGTKKL